MAQKLFTGLIPRGWGNLGPENRRGNPLPDHPNRSNQKTHRNGRRMTGNQIARLRGKGIRFDKEINPGRRIKALVGAFGVEEGSHAEPLFKACLGKGTMVFLINNICKKYQAKRLRQTEKPPGPAKKKVPLTRIYLPPINPISVSQKLSLARQTNQTHIFQKNSKFFSHQSFSSIP